MTRATLLSDLAKYRKERLWHLDRMSMLEAGKRWDSDDERQIERCLEDSSAQLEATVQELKDLTIRELCEALDEILAEDIQHEARHRVGVDVDENCLTCRAVVDASSTLTAATTLQAELAEIEKEMEE